MHHKELNTKLERGMTVVELLSVVAILAIVAGISLAGLMGMREGSRIRAAEGQMENARVNASTCIFQVKELNQPAVDGFVCGTAGLRWPQLPGGWVYLDDPLGDPADYTSNTSDRTFSFSATGDGVTVTCNEDACSSI